MSALGHKRTFRSAVADCPLHPQERPQKQTSVHSNLCPLRAGSGHLPNWIRQDPGAARLLKELAIVGHAVEELRDLLVHKLNVGSLRRGCRKVTLQ